MKKLLALLCALTLLSALSGCGKPAADVTELPISSISVVEVADPEQAIREIYAEITMAGISDADDRVLQDKFLIDPDMLEDYVVKYSSGRFGVADVFILKPVEDEVLTVREALEKVKLSRVKEFENYDIYNSYQIAQDAQIFEQGDYVIMLMLEDTEKARGIIDKYIPKS
ncbi:MULTISPECIES: DUF4358 domain-containing protein [Anaerotruncus]|jgi:hypothetical protein|uniref:DUF4358 domain-containing protein n=1 Tax=Anaerotruncus TaxID=244127 RepID=UPI00083163C6|nr:MULTISPECIES: DUF4358 domain-containing protein [Anaerotruncus]RGX56273.1 DUF4358 domain-containing protein [Anaerotruncus sp. AF02-27]